MPYSNIYKGHKAPYIRGEGWNLVKMGPHSKKEVLAVLISILFVLLVVPQVFAAEDKITLIRPQKANSSYLAIEDLSFYTCTAETDVDVRSSLFCLDDSNLVNLETLAWEDGCYMSAYDLEEIDCTNLLIQSEYLKDNENVKITELIKIRKVTSILNQIANGQFDNGGWGDAESTAYAVFAYSSFKTSFADQIEDGLNWLKLNRENVRKCWPKDDCDIKTTAKVVSLLRQAGYTDSLRVVHDGEIFLATNQNRLSGDDVWQLTFAPNITLDNATPLLQCLVNDSNSTITYSFTVNTANITNDTRNHTWDPVEMRINFTATNLLLYDVACTDNVTINVTTHTGDVVLDYTAGDNATYRVPGACWADKNRWDNCSIESTINAVLTEIDEDYKDEAIDYLESIESNDVVGEFIDDSDYGVSGRYVYALNEWKKDQGETVLDATDPELIWLYYQQNNDGSWGSGTSLLRAIDTGHVVTALESGTTFVNESINDAKDWYSENEPSSGWGTIEQASLAFNTLKGDIRPFIKAEPAHIVIAQEELSVLLYNPTTFNMPLVTLEFSSDISEFLSIEEITELGPDSARQVLISQTGVTPTDNHGFLLVKDTGVEVAKIPITVYKHETIDISYPSTLTIFGKDAPLELSISKSEATFTCEVQWDSDDISSKQSFVVSDQNSAILDLSLKNTERKQADYLGTITCTSGITVKKVPLVININQYPSEPFDMYPSNIQINETEQDFTFTLKNKLNEPISVTLKFRSSEAYFQLESSNIVLNPRAEREVTVLNLIPDGFNLSSSNVIEAESFGQTKSITMLVDILPSQLGFVLWSSVIIFVLSILIISGILFKDQIKSHIPRGALQKLNKLPFAKKLGVNFGGGSASAAAGNSASTEEDIQDMITNRKVNAEKLRVTIMINTIKILENLKKNEDQIREKLISEGFSDEDVTHAYKEIEEIEREKKKFDEQRSTISILETMQRNSAVVRSRLKQEGFNDRQIQTAFTSLRDELRDKEQKLRGELKERGVKIKEEGEGKEEKKDKK